MNYLGLNIKKIREEWELSQEEFGLLISATRGMVMQYEKRGTMPKNATVSKIIKVTGLSKDVLFNSELNVDEIPEMSQEDYILIQNFRENPDDYKDVELSDEEIKELISAKKSKIDSLTDALMLEKEMRRQDAERDKDRLYNIIEKYLIQIATNSINIKDMLSAVHKEMQAENGVMMDSFDLLLKQPVGTTASKAGTVEIAIHQQDRTEKGKKTNVHK